MHRTSHPLMACMVLPGLLAGFLSAAGLEITGSHPDGIYARGESVIWSVSTRDDPESTIRTVRYKITRDGSRLLRQGTLDLIGGKGRLEIADDQPGVLLLEVDAGGDGQARLHLTGGAILDPRQIPRSLPRPADFDDFWNARLAELARVPVNPQVTDAKSDRDGVSLALVSMDLPRGWKVRGQIARPVVGEKFPGMIIFQYAGVYALPPGKVTAQASRGWLALNISAHDLPINEPDAFYKNQEAGPLKGYPMIGNQDREQSYFLRMFLACSRAVDFLASRPDWDGRTLVVTGISQGGLQSIVAAGLNPKVTAVVVNVPAGCDTTAPLAGRPMPWPYWLKETAGRDRDAIIRTSSYFDAQNFAPRVKCPALISFGLLDRTATASGVSVMAGQLGGHVETLILTNAEHQNKDGSHDPFEKRSAIWFEALKAGRPHP